METAPMLNNDIIMDEARMRVREANERANLMGRLGDLPKPRPLFTFRRRVISLPGVIELRGSAPVRETHKARISRRLSELSASNAALDRKAS